MHGRHPRILFREAAMIEPVVTVTVALFVMASVWPTKYMMPEKVIVPLEKVSVEPLLVDG